MDEYKEVTKIITSCKDLKDDNFKKKKSKPSKKSSKHGYKFESEVLKSLEKLKLDYPELWYHKLVDTHSYDWIKSVLRELEGLITELNNLNYVRKRFSGELVRIKQILETLQKFVVPKVPADVIVFYKGQALIIECKSTQRKGGFIPFAPYVSEHQIDASIEVEGAGVPYYFFVCNRVTARQHELLVFKSKRFMKMRQWLDKENRKTCPWSRINNWTYKNLPKEKGQVFDLEFLIRDFEKRQKK